MIISNIRKKKDGTYLIDYRGLPYHATPEETPDVYAEVLEAIQNGASVTQMPGPTPPTEEELREQWKLERAALVAAITVEVDGMTFDGDEISQGRMARAIVSLQSLPDGETVQWVLSDNTVVDVTKELLSQALTLAGLRQTELWVQA